MAKYANQKNFVIHREAVDQKSGIPFLQIYCDSLEEAAYQLNGIALKLYLYFASNRDGYSFNFSPAHFRGRYNVSDNGVRKALKELIDKGFIAEEGNNKYSFSEVARKEPIFTEEKREIIDDNGDSFNLTFKELKKLINGKWTDEQLSIFWSKCKVIGGNN